MHHRQMKNRRVYLDYYELAEPPFTITPDPQFLFHSNTHRNVIDKILYGIHSRMGFVLLFGEVGTGKTTICRTILDQLDGDFETVYVINPSLSGKELLSTILGDLGIDYPQDVTKKALIDRLNDFLLTVAKNKPVVIIVDDAQTMPADALEDLRLLSNLETDKKKLLQMVLVGQPELVEHLSSPELRQLMQRVNISCQLEYLDKGEIDGYISRRLYISGEKGRIRFTRGAISTIFRSSLGNPRLINKICDYALTAGYISNEYCIRSSHVRKALNELGPITLATNADSSSSAGHAPFKIRWRYHFGWVVPLAMGLLIGVTGYRYFETGRVGSSGYPNTLQSNRIDQPPDKKRLTPSPPGTAKSIAPESLPKEKRNVGSHRSSLREGEGSGAEVAKGRIDSSALRIQSSPNIGSESTKRIRGSGQSENVRRNENQKTLMPVVSDRPSSSPMNGPYAKVESSVQEEKSASVLGQREIAGSMGMDLTATQLEQPRIKPDSISLIERETGEGRPTHLPVALMLGSYKTLPNTLQAVSIFKQKMTDVQWNPVDLGEKGIWYRVFTGGFKSKRDAFEYKAKHGLAESLIVTMPWTVAVGPVDSLKAVRALTEKLEEQRFGSVAVRRENGRFVVNMGIFVTRKGAELLAGDVNRLDVGNVSVVLR